MKKIPLTEAIALLETCLAVVITDQNRAVTYPNLHELVAEGDMANDVFLSVSYDDSEGRSYTYCFKDKDNTEVEVENTSMWLNSCGDAHNAAAREELILLAPMPLEPPTTAVHVAGGVAEVIESPDNALLIIRDFDVENSDRDLLDDHEGTPCIESRWYGKVEKTA